MMFRGRVAQSVEQWSNKPPVAGSIPVATSIYAYTFFFVCSPYYYILDMFLNVFGIVSYIKLGD